MEGTIKLFFFVIFVYFLYRFGEYSYKRGLSKGFEVTIEDLNEIEKNTESLLEIQVPKSHRFYYVKGNLDAVSQIKGHLTILKEFEE
ncbi:hypothetical protein [Enterococcus sp.]|uniref:hypothetical protein n=1 Tax=Enterococcus sp. TaxID=35783 RepID=UPI00289AF714|nr:hypothetical protein [Enterococcus sp.]